MPTTLTEDRLEFVRARYAENWTDAEIARVIGVGTSTIWRWRREILGLAPRDKFLRKFESIYGAGALRLFLDMLAENRSLAEIGVEFGFSREYARQVKEKLKELVYGQSHRDH